VTGKCAEIAFYVIRIQYPSQRLPLKKPSDFTVPRSSP
jgi:hypothetical protein